MSVLTVISDDRILNEQALLVRLFALLRFFIEHGQTILKIIEVDLSMEALLADWSEDNLTTAGAPTLVESLRIDGLSLNRLVSEKSLAPTNPVVNQLESVTEVHGELLVVEHGDRVTVSLDKLLEGLRVVQLQKADKRRVLQQDALLIDLEVCLRL